MTITVNNALEDKNHSVGRYTFPPGESGHKFLPKAVLASLLKTDFITVTSDQPLEVEGTVETTETTTTVVDDTQVTSVIDEEPAETLLEKLNNMKVFEAYSYIANTTRKDVLELLADKAKYPSVKERAEKRLASLS